LANLFGLQEGKVRFVDRVSKFLIEKETRGHKMTVMIVNPKQFLSLFYNIYFLRTGFNTGRLHEFDIVCPNLTEEDIKGFIFSTLAKLSESK